MSESADVLHPLIDAVVDEFFNDTHSNFAALEERQRAFKEGRTESRPPQLDSDNEFVVAPETDTLRRRPLTVGNDCLLLRRVSMGPLA